MSHRDFYNSHAARLAVNPIVLGTTGALTPIVIDRQGFGSVTFEVVYGSITTTGTVVTCVVKDGDATGALTSVADDYLIGTETGVSLAAGARVAGTGKEVVKRIGYAGVKRYVSITPTHSGTTSVGIVGAIAILSNPALDPVANP